MRLDLLFENYYLLIDTPEKIKELNQAILKLAVQGKLVPQDPKDEPARDLLKKIRNEKAKLIKEGKLKKEKPMPPIKEEEISHELPEGWEWARLGEISLIILGQSPPSSTYNKIGEGLPFYQGKANFGDLYPAPDTWCTSPQKIAERGDILISVRAPVGPTNICPTTSCIGRGLAAIRSLGDISQLFLLHFLRAYEKILSGKGFGTTFNAITGKDLNELLIPLAPLNEQNRIVLKVDELMKLSDDLESKLSQSKKVSEYLFRAILNGALNNNSS